MSSKKIDVTPDISLMPKLGSAGYSVPQAIAELVDNSLDACIPDHAVKIAVFIKGKEMVVADNALGMSEAEITNALKLAYSEKRGKLGEFGLGLKTACLSLGDEFDVKTKKNGERFEYTVKYDTSQWMKRNAKWQLDLESVPADIEDHYTIITIRQIKKFYPNLPNYIAADLGRRYAPFIQNGEAVILVNKKKCAKEELELLEGTLKEFQIELPSGYKITGWYGLLKQGSQKGLYGFNTFRRGRMITAYDKIGIGEHPTISRIVGEVHMDHVPPSHTKREFIKDGKEYREVEAALREECKEIIRLARQKASEEKVTKDVLSEMDIWKDSIAHALNSESFREYASRFTGLTLRPDSKSDLEAEVGSQSQGEAETKTEKHEKEDQNAKPQSPRPPQLDTTKKRHVVRIKGKNVEFNHHFANLGEEEAWKKWRNDKKQGLDIYTNIDFPAFHATKDKVFYAVIHIAESISELLIQQAEEDPGNVDEVKELILRMASKIKGQLEE